MRCYDEPIDVRVQPAGPVAFLWRHQLYVVREVLGCWRERDAWWEHLDRADNAREQRIWRVEAGSGRLAGTGVYDLAESVPTAVHHYGAVTVPAGSELAAVGAGLGGGSGDTRVGVAHHDGDATGDAGAGWRLLRAVD